MKSNLQNNNLGASLVTDFKAEVIAAELVDNGTPLDRILILMLGGSRRAYRKDVAEITEDISDYDHKGYTHVKTHKEGIYDMLPQGLFHLPTVPKSAKNEDDILDAIKKHHAEEANARKFFLPFEASVNDLRVQMALYENRLDKRLESNELVTLFSEHWEIFKWLDARQANVFLHLLPLIHNARDDHRAAETIFELMFLTPAKIAVQQQKPVEIHQPSTDFSESLLGVNFTTGSNVLISGEDSVLITLGPMSNILLHQFVNGNNQKILELLCDYLMPVSLDVTIELALLNAEKTTRLADAAGNYNASLGLSTFL